MAYVGTYRALLAGGVARPALVLDFIGLNVLDSRITFSRGTGATLTDSTGRITYAPSNLLVRSQEFDNASWAKASVNVSANSTNAPDGTLTADTVTNTNGVSSCQVNQVASLVAVPHIVSFWVQAGTATSVVFGVASGSFLSGTPSKISGPGTVSGTTLITLSGLSTTEWTRVAFAFTAAAGNNTFAIYPETTAAGTGKSVILWGAQLEPVTYQTTPSTYVATTSAAYYGPRFDYDPVTLAPKGLLIEEQRTNLLTYSEQFDNAAWTKTNATVSANAAVSPDGTANADKLIEAATTSTHEVAIPAPGITVTLAAHTLTVYAKKAERSYIFLAVYDTQTNSAYFNLENGTVGTVGGGATASITSVGNGWYRCSIVRTMSATSAYPYVRTSADGTTTSYTGDGTSGVYLWGAQLEAGAFATSYIPTVASTVTRSADVATMTGANFSSWYNQSQGSLLSSFSMASAMANFSTLPRVRGSVSRDGVGFCTTGSGATISGYQRVGGTTQYLQALGSTQVGTFKAAIAYGDTDCFVLNGTAASTSAGSSAGVIDQLVLGMTSDYFHNTIGQLWYRSIAYYNTRLPNSTLQSLTS